MTDLEKAVLEKTMARYAIWKKAHPEGPIHPSEPVGIELIEGYEMILACKALDEAEVISDLTRILKESNDGNETITIRIKDIRDVIHDALGDIRRYWISYAGEGIEWCRSDDVDAIESSLVTSLIEHRQDYDTTPWCHQCGAKAKPNCKCGPIAENN